MWCGAGDRKEHRLNMSWAVIRLRSTHIPPQGSCATIGKSLGTEYVSFMLTPKLPGILSLKSPWAENVQRVIDVV